MQIRVMLMLLAIGAVTFVGSQVMAQEAGEAEKEPALVEDNAGAPAGEKAEKPADGEPATEGETPAGETGNADKKPGRLPMEFLLIMVGGFILLYFWMSRGKKKEQQRRKDMLESLKKGDKVTTIGGIVGTVMNVKDDEITIKVDETSNTRMTFARWSVRGVGETGKAENPQEAGKKS